LVDISESWQFVHEMGSDWFPVFSIVMSVISLGTSPVNLFKVWDVKFEMKVLDNEWERNTLTCPFWKSLQFKLMDFTAYTAKGFVPS